MTSFRSSPGSTSPHGFDFPTEEDKITIFHMTPVRVVPALASVNGRAGGRADG